MMLLFYPMQKAQERFGMKILIDADGCPVVDITLETARKYQVKVMILCDTSHEIRRAGAQTIVVSKGADSVDFALVNLAQPGDVVVTQDYGLAAMCLARNCTVLDQDGMQYSSDNIDALLLSRHTAAKLRRAGGHLKGKPKRTHRQDMDFKEALQKLLA